MYMDAKRKYPVSLAVGELRTITLLSNYIPEKITDFLDIVKLIY